MGRERAKTFADRLPPVVPREEEDISHLSDEMADILYPGRRPRPFRVAIEFEPFEGRDHERALALARRSPQYKEKTEGDRRLHHAAFETRQAADSRALFQIVGSRPGTEVLVDGKRVPYATDLWLPLFWLFVGEGA
ncbi:MAG: hypothetical protein DMF78_15605 [Acidobacteria bacterium]|nr:MAG: hypothetical protein DMF78_15605 [Acidobacteriota bacterium]